jgi:uncharacterized protein
MGTRKEIAVKPLRVVFDTNTVVSALVLQSREMVWLRDVWRSGRAIPLVSRDTVSELVRVLAYPKFKLTDAEQHDLLGDFLPYSEVLAEPQTRAKLPTCRDPKDQMFLVLTQAARADALVSGDKDLLAIGQVGRIPIITTQMLRDRVG